ncbi:MAG: GNAT family N-acetyltransferase [Candidatus Eremiobacteraeota bacterium]|nr:GNAT family N-acetyltransferase [Candidatus Eremiobacteraeota bacterium]
MPMTIRMRDARPDEAPILTQLALRSKRAWGYDDAFMAAIMPDMIVEPEYVREERAIVAIEGDVILGYVIVRSDGETAFLRDLFVEPTRFRQGIGKALFGRALEYARERGARSLQLCGDPNARGFYERVGMTKVGEEPSIAGGGRMLPIMELPL